MCRFAQFFIKPLMSQDAVLREIKAVDSGKQFFFFMHGDVI
jgi:secreted Zn-dependent insulinase-like peptidase